MKKTVFLILLTIIACLVICISPKRRLINLDSQSSLANVESQDYVSHPAMGKSNVTSPYENAKYVDDETFFEIKEIYDKINFYGSFNLGNQENYDFYKTQFLRLLNGEETFTVKDTGEKYYLHQYEFLEIDYRSGRYDINNYLYVFFDIDGDEEPELCIKDNVSFNYVIDYDKKTDEFILWQGFNLSYRQILGTKKEALSSYPLYVFYMLDSTGEISWFVQFIEDEYIDSNSKKRVSCYLVMLPQHENEDKIELSENLKRKAFLEPEQNYYYFRVTKERYDELTKDFFWSTSLSYDKINEVTYTYDELFSQ